MPDASLVDSYAQAILSSALDKWVAGLETLRNGLRTEESARGTLVTTSLPLATRHAAAEQLCGPDAQSELMNLALVLVERGHLDLLDDIIATLRRISQYGPDAVVAWVTSAVPLEEDAKNGVIELLTQRYGKAVAVEWKVDPAIIGGLVIQVGDELTDGSVASRLVRLRNSLHGTG